eukprot:s2421_g8.t2
MGAWLAEPLVYLARLALLVLFFFRLLWAWSLPLEAEVLVRTLFVTEHPGAACLHCACQGQEDTGGYGDYGQGQDHGDYGNSGPAQVYTGQGQDHGDYGDPGPAQAPESQEAGRQDRGHARAQAPLRRLFALHYSRCRAVLVFFRRFLVLCAQQDRPPVTSNVEDLRLGFKLSDGDPKGVVSRSRNANKLVKPTTFFMLEASVKDPMMALEKKLMRYLSATPVPKCRNSWEANHQETVSISVFSAILTVQEESIQSEVAGVNDEVDEGSIPWRFFKFVDPGMHGKVEAVLRKNCLKPMTEPLWFRQAEPAVLLCFWANEGMTDTFVLQQQCFKQKPAASWPVDLRVQAVLQGERDLLQQDLARLSREDREHQVKKQKMTLLPAESESMAAERAQGLSDNSSSAA